MIHPTAIVDDAAEIAEDAVIGPGCLIEGSARVGPRTKLEAGVHLRGPVALGADNHLLPFCCLGFGPQSRSDPAAELPTSIAVGDGNVLREGVTIHAASRDEPTRLGDRNYLMANAHVGHDCAVGDDVVLANGVLLGGHVRLGDGVLFGGNAAIHQFCRVGRIATISGLVGIAQDVPPFCTAYAMRTVGGLNRVGLRRAGMRDHIKPLERAFSILYERGLSNASAAARIDQELADDPCCRELAAFVRDTERGITPLQGGVRGRAAGGGRAGP